MILILNGRFDLIQLHIGLLNMHKMHSFRSRFFDHFDHDCVILSWQNIWNAKKIWSRNGCQKWSFPDDFDFDMRGAEFWRCSDRRPTSRTATRLTAAAAGHSVVPQSVLDVKKLDEPPIDNCVIAKCRSEKCPTNLPANKTREKCILGVVHIKRIDTNEKTSMKLKST